jgi:hypothetical protein
MLPRQIDLPPHRLFYVEQNKITETSDDLIAPMWRRQACVMRSAMWRGFVQI